MQTVINSVKTKALGVAEYLTPVLKVSLLRFYLNIYISNWFVQSNLKVFNFSNLKNEKIIQN